MFSLVPHPLISVKSLKGKWHYVNFQGVSLLFNDKDIKHKWNFIITVNPLNGYKPSTFWFPNPIDESKYQTCPDICDKHESMSNSHQTIERDIIPGSMFPMRCVWGWTTAYLTSVLCFSQFSNTPTYFFFSVYSSKFRAKTSLQHFKTILWWTTVHSSEM